MSREIIIHQDRKFDWTIKQIATIKQLWLEDYYPTQIALAMKQDVEDITLVLMDLYFKGEIKLSQKESE